MTRPPQVPLEHAAPHEKGSGGMAVASFGFGLLYFIPLISPGLAILFGILAVGKPDGRATFSRPCAGGFTSGRWKTGWDSRILPIKRTRLIFN